MICITIPRVYLFIIYNDSLKLHLIFEFNWFTGDGGMIFKDISQAHNKLNLSK